MLRCKIFASQIYSSFAGILNNYIKIISSKYNQFNKNYQIYSNKNYIN